MLKIVLLWLFISPCTTIAQKAILKVTGFDGMVLVGYVDNGGFSNFTGPSISLSYKKSKFLLGALPSLRYKKDLSSPKNAFITPSLGIGFTYNYRFFAIQLPMYYNSKNSTNNGKWHLGFGIGLKLNELKFKRDEKV
jgi:hypothetical protein